jgi:type IV pilus assembly protein PilB
MMQVTDELRELILSGASTLRLKQEALRLGMHTLRRSALRLLRDGTTSFEEVLRVTVQE